MLPPKRYRYLAYLPGDFPDGPLAPAVAVVAGGSQYHSQSVTNARTGLGARMNHHRRGLDRVMSQRRIRRPRLRLRTQLGGNARDAIVSGHFLTLRASLRLLPSSQDRTSTFYTMTSSIPSLSA